MRKIIPVFIIVVVCSVLLSGCLFLDDSSDGSSSSGGGSSNTSYSVWVPDTALTFAYRYQDHVYNKVKITDFSYEVSYSGYLTLFLSGEKVYDEDDGESNDLCIFAYKIYDDDNYVVDSGAIYTDNLYVGEKFRNLKHTTLCKLEKGRHYRVVFSDYVF